MRNITVSVTDQAYRRARVCADEPVKVEQRNDLTGRLSRDLDISCSQFFAKY